MRRKLAYQWVIWKLPFILKHPVLYYTARTPVKRSLERVPLIIIQQRYRYIPLLSWMCRIEQNTSSCIIFGGQLTCGELWWGSYSFSSSTSPPCPMHHVFFSTWKKPLKHINPKITIMTCKEFTKNVNSMLTSSVAYNSVEWRRVE